MMETPKLKYKDDPKAYKKKWYEDNRERLQQKQKLKYVQNRDVILNKAKDYALKNKEKIIAYRKEYAVTHKLKKKLDHQKYYTNNKEHVLAKTKEYREANLEKMKAANKRWNEEHKETQALKMKENYRINKKSIREEAKTAKVRYSTCRSKAKQAGRDFEISFEVFKSLISMPCHYCNCNLRNMSGYSLDRIDNSKGYLETNLLPCCGDCNRTRGNRWTVEETEVMIKAVMEFRKKKALEAYGD